MPSVYHGSRTLFAKPDFRYIKDQSGYGANEYGFGFYASSYAGDAHERAFSHDSPCFIYEINISDKRYNENWLKSKDPVGRDIVERTAAIFDKRNQPAVAQSIRDLEMDVTGAEFHTHLRYNISGLSPRAISSILADADVDGYCEGDYYVFFDKDTIPELFIHSAYNLDKNTAVAAHDVLKKTAAGYQDNNREFSNFDFMSDQARYGYYTLLELDDPQLTQMYVTLIKQSQEHRGFFGLRDSLGHVVQRSAMINPANNDHAYFGTTIFNAVEMCREGYITPDGFVSKLEEFIEKLADHPIVRIYAANRPQQETREPVGSLKMALHH